MRLNSKQNTYDGNKDIENRVTKKKTIRYLVSNFKIIGTAHSLV